MTRGITVLGLTLATAALAAGCGQKKLNSDELEGELSRQLGAQAGQAPKSVACPEEITAEQGKKFDCTLTAQNGDQVKVNVTLTNDDGGFRANVPQQEIK